MAPSPWIRKSGGCRPYVFIDGAGTEAIGRLKGIAVPMMGFRHSPGSGAMNKQFVLATRILCRSVDRHRKARRATLRVERWTRALWSPLRRLLCKRVRGNEMAALRAVASTRPAHPDEAREKLFYLMALTIADGVEPGRTDMETAIETLRPFQNQLADLWEDRPVSDPAPQ